MMQRRRLAAVLAVGALSFAVLAHGAARAADGPRHIRGSVVSLQDHVLTVKTARGANESVGFGDDAKVFLVSPADLSAVTSGKFVGITSVEKDGKRVAVEVHVFDESLRGLGEGHYPWDLDAGPNMMTNANIAQVDSVAGDRVLKLDYKGGTQSIAVPTDAAIVQFTNSTPDLLTPGAKVFVIAVTGADGKTAGKAVVVGKDGLKPPM